MKEEENKKYCKDCGIELDNKNVAYLNGELYCKCCLDWILNS